MEKSDETKYNDEILSHWGKRWMTSVNIKITAFVFPIVSMELEAETGRIAPGHKHADKWAESLKTVYDNEKERVSEEYWRRLIPAAGREAIKTWADNLCLWDYK